MCSSEGDVLNFSSTTSAYFGVQQGHFGLRCLGDAKLCWLVGAGECTELYGNLCMWWLEKTTEVDWYEGK